MIFCWNSVLCAQVIRSYSFRGAPNDGGNPNGGLVSDAQGNLYGVASEGGAVSSQCPVGCGTVFEFSRTQAGQWTENTIYAFTGQNGLQSPIGTLAIDAKGNLYGVTASYPGSVFELTPSQNGNWIENTIYYFAGPPNGAVPTGGLVFDTEGSLYGSTSNGGTCSQYDCTGIIFKLSPEQNESWSEATIYTFQNDEDGHNAGPLVFGNDGNLYGTTLAGGTSRFCQCGTVFQLVNAGGLWTKSILYSFTGGLDGNGPTGPVVFDQAGNLYGETNLGGSLACPNQGCGVVYKLSPGAQNSWAFNLVHTFNGLYGELGSYPSGGLVFDTEGNLYGTTSIGGDSTNCGANGCGTIFKLWQQENSWKFALLSFNGTNGTYPEYGVIVGNDDSLYGATFVGGTHQKCQDDQSGCGTAFAVIP